MISQPWSLRGTRHRTLRCGMLDEDDRYARRVRRVNCVEDAGETVRRVSDGVTAAEVVVLYVDDKQCAFHGNSLRNDQPSAPDTLPPRFFIRSMASMSSIRWRG